VKFPCNICTHNHLTHLLSKVGGSSIFFVQWDAHQQPTILTNPFLPQGQKMVVGVLNNPIPHCKGETKVPLNKGETC
jgi:hypothetical protein